MPNKNWGKRGQAYKMRLTAGKRDAQGTHPKCEECPLVETCDSVQYRARGLSYFFCTDNPNERGKMSKSKLFIKLIKPSKKELEFIEHREICTKQIEEAFGYTVPPFKVGLDFKHKKRKEENNG